MTRDDLKPLLRAFIGLDGRLRWYTEAKITTVASTNEIEWRFLFRLEAVAVTGVVAEQCGEAEPLNFRCFIDRGSSARQESLPNQAVSRSSRA